MTPLLFSLLVLTYSLFVLCLYALRDDFSIDYQMTMIIMFDNIRLKYNLTDFLEKHIDTQ